MNTTTRIKINGREYENVAAMPSEDRVLYERMHKLLHEVEELAEAGTRSDVIGKHGDQEGQLNITTTTTTTTTTRTGAARNLEGNDWWQLLRAMWGVGSARQRDTLIGRTSRDGAAFNDVSVASDDTRPAAKPVASSPGTGTIIRDDRGGRWPLILVLLLMISALAWWYLH